MTSSLPPGAPPAETLAQHEPVITVTLVAPEWRSEMIAEALGYGGEEEPLLACLPEPRMRVRVITEVAPTMIMLDGLGLHRDPVGLGQAIVRVVAEASDVPVAEITAQVRFPSLRGDGAGCIMLKGPFTLWLRSDYTGKDGERWIY